MKSKTLKKIIIAIKLDAGDTSEESEEFGAANRIPLVLWPSSINKVMKKDEGRKIEVRLAKVSMFQGQVKLSANATTSIELGPQDPTYVLAEEEQLPFTEPHTTPVVSFTRLVDWNQAITMEAPCTVELRALLSVGTSYSYAACPMPKCSAKKLLLAVRGGFTYYCPECKNGVNEPKQAKRGTIPVKNPSGNKKETITATAFDKNITIIQQYEAEHDGSTVVFQIKLRKEIVDGTLEYTLNELTTA